MSIELNSDQVFARYEAARFWESGNDQVFEIAGAAGTGKTTTIKIILKDIGVPLNKVLFTAFTGKAATQLARHGLPAMTTCSAFYDYEPEVVRDENGKIVILPNGKVKTATMKRKKDHLKKDYVAIVIDEGTMINETERKDIESFGLPMFVLGDINQLPPVFGRPAFMLNPNVVLNQLMRQAENDPIVMIAHRIINGQSLSTGVYGQSAIVKRSDLNEMHFKSNDVVICGTNKLRFAVNDMFRTSLLGYRDLSFPHIGEKLLCKRNNWGRCVGDNIYLTNGTLGFVDYVDRESFNGKKIKIDFRPDYTKKVFRNVNVDYQRLMRTPEYLESGENALPMGMDSFDFGYCVTTHASQGSQWERVLGLAEIPSSDLDYIRKYLYTMVTRACSSLTLGIEKDKLYLS